MDRHDNFCTRKLYEDDVNNIDHGNFVAEGMEGGEENGAPVDEVVAPEVHVGHVREDEYFNDVVAEQDTHYPVDEVVAPEVHGGHVREDKHFNDVVTEQDEHYLQNINHDIPHLSPQNKSETEKNWSGENGQKQSSTSIIIKQSSTSIIIKQSSTLNSNPLLILLLTAHKGLYEKLVERGAVEGKLDLSTDQHLKELQLGQIVNEDPDAVLDFIFNSKSHAGAFRQHLIENYEDENEGKIVFWEHDVRASKVVELLLNIKATSKHRIEHGIEHEIEIISLSEEDLPERIKKRIQEVKRGKGGMTMKGMLYGKLRIQGEKRGGGSLGSKLNLINPCS